MKDIMKIVKSQEESGLLIKDKAKEQEGRPRGILLVSLVASLLGNMLAGKGIIRTSKELYELEKVWSFDTA